MEILINVGHDHLFNDELEKMGFITAVIEIALQRIDPNAPADVDFTCITTDKNTGERIILRFRPGAGIEHTPIPGYLEFLERFSNDAV